ncbi:DoxX family protein [Staphylococcus warneri]|uniref:DoxX family protein n=1 Tax=Staphylococcus warneri TaxID=1292 RepID=A0A2T4PZU4_STAWA|nr:DoxX family protein [Staphylococcus warneri]PTI14122.1 DoxX family protein [Staphylococcus warneri]PTI17248.1 DoxX family protein [Staphylococcus warneri]PTI25030.1 DoxX family protein [Staphylococcus warneri]PTI34841.1 DoxX family protein [Staphylococcus warneri]PTI50781.1 DoxX family protein [Staphylococcus warneri]
MRLGLLLIRLMLGITFTIHGSQKVFSGFKEPMEMMSGLGFPAFLGIILGVFEFIGGILMIIGLFSNYVAAGFIVIMLGALFTVHLSQGYMASELVILLLIMSIAVMVSYNWKKLLEIY